MLILANVRVRQVLPQCLHALMNVLFLCVLWTFACFNYNIFSNMTAPEYRETCLFHQWLEGQRIPHTHIVNEQPNRKRAIAEKQMGKSKGFPDMLVFLPNGVNVAIEMKRCDKPAYATTEQKRWLAFLASRGFKCAICHGCEEAVQFVRECSCENKSA